MLELAKIDEKTQTFMVDGEVFPARLYIDYEELMRNEQFIDDKPISPDYTGKDKEFDLQYQHKVTMDVLQLLRTFEKQGHSGFSAPFVARVFMQRVKRRPLSPLTGEEDEWTDSYDENTQQNRRCTAVFRENHDNSTARYIHGRYFREPNSESYFSCKESNVKVTFPCDPKDLEPKYYVLKYPAEDEGEHSIGNQIKNGWYTEER